MNPSPAAGADPAPGLGPDAVPASGDRRRHPAPAHLRFFHGPMDCGKSTLALQVDHNQSRQGRPGCCSPSGDRSARPRITSRVGLSRPAAEIDAGTDLRLLVRSRWAGGQRVDYLVVDEAQFLTPEQVDQLAELVDGWHVDVYAFGLTTDFRARLFAGTQRLLELADDVQRIQVEVLCWCGLPGPAQRPGGGRGDGPRGRHRRRRRHRPRRTREGRGDVRYQVLCRRHHVRGQLGPTATGPGQLALP